MFNSQKIIQQQHTKTILKEGISRIITKKNTEKIIITRQGLQ
jgi:hypothetical protein